MANYVLYFSGLKIADVRNSSEEFLANSAEYSLDANFLAAAQKNNAENNIAMQILSMRNSLMHSDEDEMPDDEAFSDLIESEDWVLVESDGTRLPILVPIFNDENWLSWRWNVDA